ncbi:MULTISPECIES: hypothetical protein [unclassified Cryobacterium]|nr:MULTISPECIES: hypothetical protein [unclassified Cryobacterium]
MAPTDFVSDYEELTGKPRVEVKVVKAPEPTPIFDATTAEVK